MNTTTDYRDSWINPRIKIAALWASMMFVFAYVDLFSLYRADVRADLEAGKMFAFTIGQGFLLGVTLYIALPSLMVFLSLVLPVKMNRVANIVLPVIYGITIVGGAVGEWDCSRASPTTPGPGRRRPTPQPLPCATRVHRTWRDDHRLSKEEEPQCPFRVGWPT